MTKEEVNAWVAGLDDDGCRAVDALLTLQQRQAERKERERVVAWLRARANGTGRRQAIALRLAATLIEGVMHHG